MNEVPEPNSQLAIRNLLYRVFEMAATGQLLSLVVAAETTNGKHFLASTEPENAYALESYMRLGMVDVIMATERGAFKNKEEDEQ